MPGTDLKGIVDRIVDLPTLPQVVNTLLTLLDDPASSARDVNEIMAHDPALVAKILKLVNSAFYGLPNRVTSIQQAIAILGFNTIKALAVSASVFDLFGDSVGEFSYEAFWKQSVGVATVTSYLAGRSKRVDTESGFVIGLLHGIGKLILDQYAPAEFQSIVALARERNISFAAAERQVIQTGYAELGYWLTQRWKLADEVQQAILHQNRVRECAEQYRPAAAALAMAIYICRVKQYGGSGDYDAPMQPLDAWEALLLRREDVPEIIGRVETELQRAKEFLDVIQA